MTTTLPLSLPGQGMPETRQRQHCPGELAAIGRRPASPGQAAALYKDAVGETPSAVVGAWISGVATAGVLTGVHPLAPNLLLYTNVI